MTKNLTTHDRKRATLKHMHDVLDQVHHSKLKAPALHHDFIGIGLITPRMTVELQFPHDGKEVVKEIIAKFATEIRKYEEFNV